MNDRPIGTVLEIIEARCYPNIARTQRLCLNIQYHQLLLILIRG